MPIAVVSILFLSASVSGPDALDLERARVAQAGAELTRMAERAPATGPAMHAVRDQRELEFPLSALQIRRAETARAAAAAMRTGRSAMPCHAGGDARQPLAVYFADYTLDIDGQPVPGSGGWTQEERERLSGFLCRMLPLARERYGAPFQRWAITLVKDLYYSGSWIFIPSTLEVHAGGSWNPRLLTHEMLHAFRGQRTLTSDTGWQYDPTLSGFEEGFAEGLAYLLMNEYVARYCQAGQCGADVPSDGLWDSWLEGFYDFSNDSSLTTVDFWSDGGGTLKYYERYLMAAAALMRLETAVPSFARRFNAAYYERIRADPAYRPSRDRVIELIESLAPRIEGRATRAWVERQRIFDCRVAPGKKDWLVNYTPFSTLDQLNQRMLIAVETFPSGSDWAQYIPDCPLVPEASGPYLFYRLRDVGVRVDLERMWTPQIVASHSVHMRTPPGNASYRVRGCNDVVGSYGAVEIYQPPQPSSTAACDHYSFPEPVCLEPPSAWGLHALHTHWDNPQYGGSPEPPSYAMLADASQAAIDTLLPLLAGVPPAAFDGQRHVFVGGVLGASTGTLKITHSQRPGELSVPVANGAFYAEPPSCPQGLDDGLCWVRYDAVATSRRVTVPGTLRFTFDPGGGGRVLSEERIVVFGSVAGRHHFLLGTRPTAN